MKNMKYILFNIMCCLALMSCDSFIDVPPTAVIDEDTAFSNPESMVNAVYSALGNDWFTYPFNLWPYGDLASDDCMKGGSGTTDTDYHALDIWSAVTPMTPGHTDELWYRLYVAISRCNRAIISLDKYGENTLGAETAAKRKAEVRFLRGHFYYKLLTVFRQVPWIDEKVFAADSYEQTRNDEFTYAELWQKVIDDFTAAYTTLDMYPPSGEGGRVSKTAATGYLAKCYLQMAWGDGYENSDGTGYQNKDYFNKVIEYTDYIKTATKYSYESDYGDIFMSDHKNGVESLFAVQHSEYTDDGTKFGRANWSNTLNGAWKMWSCGWDFHCATQNLVNAFKTYNGLPMFDEYDNVHNSYPVMGKSSSQKWDPRLFHTIALPTFPYKYESTVTADGVNTIFSTENSRNPSTYGYYRSLKEIPQRSKGETYNYPWQAFDNNDYVIRYTDVMLMRAEALIETDKLDEARIIINDIRQRAANSINKHIAYAADYCQISLYPASYFADKETARKCLQWERRIEMGMESSRFFDLRRWGIASKTLNKFYSSEKNDNYEGQSYGTYYSAGYFTPNKNEFLPIPYNQMYYVSGLYTQNKGY